MKTKYKTIILCEFYTQSIVFGLEILLQYEILHPQPFSGFTQEIGQFYNSELRANILLYLKFVKMLIVESFPNKLYNLTEM